jgi:hypothetical protein
MNKVVLVLEYHEACHLLDGYKTQEINSSLCTECQRVKNKVERAVESATKKGGGYEAA